MNVSGPQAARQSSRPRAPRKSKTRPFSQFEILLATRYLRARRQEGWISVVTGFSLAGIALGVATLIVVMSVMNGFRAEIMSKILGFRGHYAVIGTTANFEGWQPITNKLSKINGVTRATPYVEGHVLTNMGTNYAPAVVRGVRPQDLAKIQLVAESLSPGALQRYTRNSETVLVGELLARDLGLLPGMEISILTHRGNVTPFGVTPRSKAYRVAGTFKVGMSIYDKGMIFMPLSESQIFFNRDNAISGIEVMVTSPDEVTALRPRIEAAAPGTQIFDWTRTDPEFFSALEVERAVMFLILTLMIIVAGFNIISGMIMLVKDKTRDIAILRTMGAARGSVLRVFLMSGSAIGIVGTFIGWILGVLLCWNIESIRQALIWLTGVNLFPETLYFLSRLPAKMETGEISLVVGISLVLTVLATVYPAYRAARLDPVEALRYE